MYYKYFLLLLSISFSFTACIPSNVYEKNYSFSSHQWNNKTKPSFAFNITDTSSNYAVFIMMRHTDAYPFANLWVNINTMAPDGSIKKQRVELPLAENSGKWLGRGTKAMDEVYEHKISLNSNGSTHFDKKGTYTITLEQIMRSKKLPHVMSIGIRLEKIRSQ